jgi:hypothetical protein
MEKILSFIRDTVEAYDAFNVFYKIEPATKGQKSLIVRFGCELNLVNEEGIPISLNDACKDLIESYQAFPISIDYGQNFILDLSTRLERFLLNSDEQKRLYIARSFICEYSSLLSDAKFNTMYHTLEQIDEYGFFYYNERESDKEVYVYRTNDTLRAFDALSITYWLLHGVIVLFRSFMHIYYLWGIDIKQFVSNMIGDINGFDLRLFGIEGEAKNYPEKDVISTPDICLRGRRESEATVKMKCEVITALIKVSSYELPTGKALASFIAWLCGGNMENIRQRGLSQNTMGTENQEIIKAKFESIGISYEDGKIRPIIKK